MASERVPDPRTEPRLGPAGETAQPAPVEVRKASLAGAMAARAAPIVPPQSVAGSALLLVVAIMSFLACLTVGAVTLIRDAADSWQVDVAREMTIQVKPIDGIAIEGEIAKALAIARAAPGVASAELVSEAETLRLLEPWLGAGLDLADLPIPRLIKVAFADPSAADLDTLRTKLGSDVKGAVLDDHRVWIGRLRTMAGTMVAAGVAVLVLVLTAMVLSVVFATRGAMAGNRDVIEVLHFVGAEDGFIAGEFQRHFLLLGLKGGIAGGVLAMVCFVVGGLITRDSAGGAAAAQLEAMFGGLSVGFGGYIGAVTVVFVIALLTALTSRYTVRRYLAGLA
jgi:cell division transport system permease protein